MFNYLFGFFFLFLTVGLTSQTIINIYPDSTLTVVGNSYTPGVFYVPKTVGAQTDFLNNGIHQNSIRLNIIESALNNTTNLNDCLSFLDTVKPILIDLANKTDKLIFIFEKMPAWLSSSSDGSPAATPGWYVLNTKPPANYTNWTNMVDSVTKRLTVNYGINNAYFEIWNEPDLGSWTGTENEFFELFQNTYDAIKSVNPSLKVGGVATNYWANGINYQPSYGYISNQVGDSSLLGRIIDSAYVWSKSLDFVSWHNFGIAYQANKNAQDYISQKYASLSMAVPEMIISEWNVTSNLRDTPLQKSFFAKNLMELTKTTIAANAVAAWQDFEYNPIEFHADYGLLTYNDIHKPCYNSMLLANMLNGVLVKHNYNIPTDITTSIYNDTLYALITNYTPPALAEALNHTLFEGEVVITQLDSIGYIDILGGDVTPLDSIYKGLKTIPNTSAINMAVNNSIPVYQHLDSLQLTNRTFQLNISGLIGQTKGIEYKIDSTKNNLQHKYDSLIGAGYNQTSASNLIVVNQSLNYDSVTLTNGQLSFTMQPNSVSLFKIPVSQTTSIKSIKRNDIKVYPNPTNGDITIKLKDFKEEITLSLYSLSGQLISTKKYSRVNSIPFQINQPKGMYMLEINDGESIVRLNIEKF